MIADFISRTLVVLLGYAYPAFECYKMMEKNRADIDQLRFWCQYWIIIALLTVFERFGDVFVSWLPLYGEMKLGFVIYLWYPKTKGVTYIYETFLRPNVARYETDIDQMLGEFKAKAWDLAIFHLQNCWNYGHTTFIQFLQYLAAQSTRASDNPSQEKAQPPSPPQKPNLLVSRPPNNAVHVQDQHHLLQEQVSKVQLSDSDNTLDHESDIAKALRAARTRLRR